MNLTDKPLRGRQRNVFQYFRYLSTEKTTQKLEVQPKGVSFSRKCPKAGTAKESCGGVPQAENEGGQKFPNWLEKQSSLLKKKNVVAGK
ncbi:hypothetical protein [Sphingobacterium multivorum]|uniref:hypothetical protein n=1 Tax=Sphingobacterium multivorum TaxID=28454 RepID=UPI0028AD767C|nr:hypothetical protein [Sphingobacterium multivorum]